MEKDIVCMETLAQNLKNRGYICEIADSASAVLAIVESHISKSDIIGNGGSVTLSEIGLFAHLNKDGYNVISMREGIEYPEVVTESRNATVFISSTNAIAESGELINIDGRGNRISHMCHGAKTMIYVVSQNKISKDISSAIWRARNVAGPLNCVRLGKKTPCTKDLKCHDCNSPDRICRGLLISALPMSGQKAIVVLVKENLGY